MLTGMSGIDNWQDNTPMTSFLGTLKKELFHIGNIAPGRKLQLKSGNTLKCATFGRNSRPVRTIYPQRHTGRSRSVSKGLPDQGYGAHYYGPASTESLVDFQADGAKADDPHSLRKIFLLKKVGADQDHFLKKLPGFRPVLPTVSRRPSPGYPPAYPRQNHPAVYAHPCKTAGISKAGPSTFKSP